MVRVIPAEADRRRRFTRTVRLAADRFGLSWQIVPKLPGDMMSDPEREKAKRAAGAMMQMFELDVAALDAAFSGEGEETR